jgi:hypothetical protein
MQLDLDLTLKKTTDMARQSESVRKQQSLVKNDLCDTTVDAVKTKTRNQRERLPNAETNKTEQDVGDVDIARTIQETIAQQKE